ncbi:MAG: cysteine dioxygenase [Burkholderiales bacterium]
MERNAERAAAIAAAVADIRTIESAEGVTRQSLARIRARLMQLAARTDLFTLDDFPPPVPGSKRTSCLYRLSEDDDHRFALYANSGGGQYDTPPHNHTTWAVIVGIEGDEVNRFYDRDGSGVARRDAEHVVRQGSGVSFLPDDLHSIHINGRVLNFHMYGMALEQLHRREFYTAADGSWKVFPPHTDIREARTAVRA